MRTMVVQYAVGPECYAQIESTRYHHRRLFADANWEASIVAVDYFPKIQSRHPYWEKPLRLSMAAELFTGVDRLIWLDADSVMLSAEFPEFNTPFAMTWHDPDDEPHHFNCGVIYMHNTPAARYWLKEWIQTRDDGHKWHDQWAFHKIAKDFPELVTRLDHRWNSVDYIPKYRAENPVVKAWHGFPGDRAEQLRLAIEEFNRHRETVDLDGSVTDLAGTPPALH